MLQGVQAVEDEMGNGAARRIDAEYATRLARRVRRRRVHLPLHLLQLPTAVDPIGANQGPSTIPSRSSNAAVFVSVVFRRVSTAGSNAGDTGPAGGTAGTEAFIAGRAGTAGTTADGAGRFTPSSVEGRFGRAIGAAGRAAGTVIAGNAGGAAGTACGRGRAGGAAAPLTIAAVANSVHGPGHPRDHAERDGDVIRGLADGALHRADQLDELVGRSRHTSGHRRGRRRRDRAAVTRQPLDGGGQAAAAAEQQRVDRADRQTQRSGDLAGPAVFEMAGDHDVALALAADRPARAVRGWRPRRGERRPRVPMTMVRGRRRRPTRSATSGRGRGACRCTSCGR